MPKFLQLQRLNRRAFLLISGLLWLLWLIGLITVGIVYSADFSPTLPAIMKLVMNIVNLKYYLLVAMILAALVFSYAYLGRFMDGNLSPWFAVIVLGIFYSLLLWVMIDFVKLWQESNLLFFMAKLKRFLAEPTITAFQALFAPEWLKFMAEKKRLLELAIVVYLGIIVIGMVIPSQRQENRYGAPQRLSSGAQFFSLLFSLFFIGITIVLLALGYLFWQLGNPVDYLADYEAFMELLRYWRAY